MDNNNISLTSIVHQDHLVIHEVGLHHNDPDIVNSIPCIILLHGYQLNIFGSTGG